MPTRLRDLADREQEVEVCCLACGRRLGRYSTMNDEGVTLHDDPRPDEDYRVRTGARNFLILQERGDGSRSSYSSRYAWRCGKPCGADIQRRADRLGELEVDEHTDPPRVYV